MLTKTRTVLHLANAHLLVYGDGDWRDPAAKIEDWPIFQPEIEEELHGGRDTFVHLDIAVFNEMGRPETITVTVEPGDMLNSEEPDGT